MEALISTIAALVLGAVLGWVIPVKRGIAMKWEKIEVVAPVTRHKMSTGKVDVSIAPACGDSGEFWQHILVSVGEHSQPPVELCLKNWPREALRLARAALDEFEAKLNEEGL